MMLPSPLREERIKRESEVSEPEQPVELPRPARPLESGQTSQTPEVVVDDSGTRPMYLNFCRVTATPEEVILDFGLNPEPFAARGQNVKVVERIVMNLYTAKRLLTAIDMTIQRHEQTFGAIELDVRRRLRSPQS